MSGRKYTTIDQTELNKLRWNASKAISEAQKRAAAERAAARAQEELAAAKARNKTLEGRIEGLDEKLRNADAQASALRRELHDSVKQADAALKAQSQKFTDALVDTRREFADAMDKNNRRIEQVIDEKEKAIRDDLAALAAKTERDTDALRTRVTAIEEKVGDPAALCGMAKDYADVAVQLLEDAKSLRYELFLPGRMEEVVAALDQAAASAKLAANNPAAASAALLDGRNAFEAAKKFREDLLAAEAAWQAKLALAMEALTAAEEAIDANAKITYEGKEMDVNHWSNGALEQLRELVAKLRGHLEDADTVKDLSLQDLETIAVNAQLIADGAGEALTGAWFALECSDTRVGLAADLFEDLAEKAGMEIVKSRGYEGDDQRAANMIHLKNGVTGFEVVITLIPVMHGGELGYEARTDIVNKGSSAEVADTFEEVLREVMGDYGLSGDCPVPVNPKKAEEVGDWKTRKQVCVPTVSTPAAAGVKIPKKTTV